MVHFLLYQDFHMRSAHDVYCHVEGVWWMSKRSRVLKAMHVVTGSHVRR